MSKGFDSGSLWTPRSVEDTMKLYADWAQSYDSDVGEAGYETPARIASTLAAAMPDRTRPVLDFGCGTGLSGMALAGAGFTTVDGTDISPEMLSVAGAKPCYRRLWRSRPGEPPQVRPGDYAAITATGVVSLGAAPPQTLSTLLTCLAPGGLLALSYNDATLTAAPYQQALADVQVSGRARLLSAKHGMHLVAKGMGSTVYLLERL